ncbi:hypothetical protein BC828DRAFT_374161 [Blastocladiella britannica]|nr:hypothetical protein BC828DRAFT_374161 [Blastocladiella britannica]
MPSSTPFPWCPTYDVSQNDPPLPLLAALQLVCFSTKVLQFHQILIPIAFGTVALVGSYSTASMFLRWDALQSLKRPLAMVMMVVMCAGTNFFSFCLLFLRCSRNNQPLRWWVHFPHHCSQAAPIATWRACPFRPRPGNSLVYRYIVRAAYFALQPYSFFDAEDTWHRLIPILYFAICFAAYSIMLMFWFRLSVLAFYTTFPPPPPTPLYVSAYPGQLPAPTPPPPQAVDSRRIYRMAERGGKVLAITTFVMFALLAILWVYLGAAGYQRRSAYRVPFLRHLSTALFMLAVGVIGALAVSFLVLSRAYHGHLKAQSDRDAEAADLASSVAGSSTTVTTAPSYAKPSRRSSTTVNNGSPASVVRELAGSVVGSVVSAGAVPSDRDLLESVPKELAVATQLQATRIAVLTTVSMMVLIFANTAVMSLTVLSGISPDAYLNLNLIPTGFEWLTIVLLVWFLAVIPGYTDRVFPASVRSSLTDDLATCPNVRAATSAAACAAASKAVALSMPYTGAGGIVTTHFDSPVGYPHRGPSLTDRSGRSITPPIIAARGPQPETAVDMAFVDEYEMQYRSVYGHGLDDTAGSPPIPPPAAAYSPPRNHWSVASHHQQQHRSKGAAAGGAVRGP